MADQPEALRMAEILDHSKIGAIDVEIAAELRRQHAEIERLTKCLHYEQHLATRIGTHGTGCHAWGPSHYECLLRECERLREYADTLVRERNAAWAESAELRGRAELFDALQNMPVEEAQAYFWNYSSRKTRAKAIRDRVGRNDAAMKETK